MDAEHTQDAPLESGGGMHTGQGVGLPELDPRVRDHILDAAKGYLRKTRTAELRDLMDLHSLLERFYRYGLEDRDV